MVKVLAHGSVIVQMGGELLRLFLVIRNILAQSIDSRLSGD